MPCQIFPCRALMIRAVQNISVPCRAWYQDLSTRILVPGSWCQDLGTRILVQGSWYHDPRTKILVATEILTPRVSDEFSGACYQDLCTRCWHQCSCNVPDLPHRIVLTGAATISSLPCHVETTVSTCPCHVATTLVPSVPALPTGPIPF